MEILLFTALGVAYTIFAVCIGKLIHMIQLWEVSKKEWSKSITIKPEPAIFAGIFWPFSLPFIIIIYTGVAVIMVIKEVFYKGA